MHKSSTAAGVAAVRTGALDMPPPPDTYFPCCMTFSPPVGECVNYVQFESLVMCHVAEYANL